MVNAGTTNQLGKLYSFLFTDIEGSTRLWEQFPERMSLSLAYHNRLMSDAIESHNGKVFKTIGDAYCAVFDSATDALDAAIAAQTALAEIRPSENDPIFALKVRMGLHAGPAEEVDNDYFGPSLNRVARLMSAANGGQILISSQFKVQQQVANLEFRDLGLHRLKDLAEPMHVYQIIIPGVLNNYSAIRTLSARPTNLPIQLSSFVGREAEVEAICRRIRQPGVRLLTLFGPGGIGKTRLSLRVGTVLRDEYEHGVFFVALSPVKTEAGLLEAIASALHVEETTDAPLLEALKSHLQSLHLLLILDNFEQVIDAAPVLNELLTSAANLNLLVTSREELLIYGEQIYPLTPLSVPKKNTIVPLNRLMEYSAINLFVERVRAMQSDFELTEDNAKYVIEICQSLDGLPLAIELASVRVREFELEDILAQLTQRLQVLSKGARDLPARQRTIRGAIDWSYQLLSPDEQAAFTRLAIFVGAFTANAVDRISGAEYLNRLKEKSLVQQLDTSDDTPLYIMLDTLREFAAENLEESGEIPDLRAKHLDYYRELVARAEPNLTGTEQMIWFKRLEYEQFNIQAALEWSLDENLVEYAGNIVGVLWRYWGAHSRLNTGSQWIARVLESADQLSAALRAKVLLGAGRLAFLQSRLEQAAGFLGESLTLYEQVNDTEYIAAVNLSLGEIAFYQGNTLLAENCFHTSLAIYQSIGDNAGFARCLTQLGRLAHEQTNLAGAETLFQQSLELTRTYGSTESTAIAVNDLAEVFRVQGRYAEAAALYRESLQLYRDLEFEIGIAVMLHNLAQVTRKLGDNRAAYHMLQEAVTLLQTLEEKQVVTECFAALGAVYVHLDRLDFAIVALSAAQRIMDVIGVSLGEADELEYREHLALAQARVEPDFWTRFWERGQSMSLERLVADILQDYEPA
jgi:predicted ATPase/class 3 adenylate cyclase